MGLTTIAAARWYDIQEKKLEGSRESLLSWEKWPFAALSRTYNVDLLTPDSAGTATAFLTGSKTVASVVGVDANVKIKNCSTVEKAKINSIAKSAIAEGKSVGVVTTTRITHATPSALYAHAAYRYYEGSADLPTDQVCEDIASQLINGEVGKKLKVMLGGGRYNFIPKGTYDAEYTNKASKRSDDLNLIEKWKKMKKEDDNLTDEQYKYVQTLDEFNAIDTDKVDYLLGLFNPSHMQYEAHRSEDIWKEPSLSEMVEKAIKILKKNPKGYFLLVEGGRIDHGHHDNQAFLSIKDASAFNEAIAHSQQFISHSDTLQVVTADHSHSFTVSGYSKRTDNILKFATSSNETTLADDKKPYNILAYTTGPGYKTHRKDGPRKDLTKVDTTDPDFVSDSFLPRQWESHGGEDVAIYAKGPWAHLFHSVHEQNYVNHVFEYAMCIGKYKSSCNKTPAGTKIDKNSKEHSEYWKKIGENELKIALEKKKLSQKAKNTVLFVGDGMGLSTVTAARWHHAQKRQIVGSKSQLLSWEDWPDIGLSRTYTVDSLTADSAGSGTALLSGIKTYSQVLGVDMNTKKEICSTTNDGKIDSIAQHALKEGKSVGVITTSRITDATPAALYAHSAFREWEGWAPTPCKDIATQLIEGSVGKQLKVILGGGRKSFIPKDKRDEEDISEMSTRKDNKDLRETWKSMRKDEGLKDDKFAYVERMNEFNSIDPKKVDYLLGLFSGAEMNYEANRLNDTWGEPSLGDMAKKAIEILKKNPKGYLLLVEGGRIDHGHHHNLAHLALDDTLALHDAVEKVEKMTKNDDTLKIVTADHSHSFIINGYSDRSESIFGFARNLEGDRLAEDKKTYTILSYTNGPGYHSNRINDIRKNLTLEETTNPHYAFDSGVPLEDETHSGEDVAIYAKGPFSHLIHGVHEQNYIPYVISYSMCIGKYNKAKHCSTNGNDKLNSMNIYKLLIISVILLFHAK
ncbi:DgyrCDS5862 [Dimorphilus gyrociliatus]|nr:DgyrCDS5862 [Dimorphilus gyrociliatus]